ncbi:hypothetical protein [Rhodoligotrophos defluvii]|uniref:hypothetical protein n=1 Tax=Rhodoligotrophos defluvii TaxID=2561934 RepID=UPI003D175BD3
MKSAADRFVGRPSKHLFAPLIEALARKFRGYGGFGMNLGINPQDLRRNTPPLQLNQKV